MHIQNPPPGWTHALPCMPDGGLVLSVDNGDTLLAAKAANPKLITAFRHYFDDQQFSADYAQAVEIVRRNRRSFIDGTYRDRYAQAVDLVLEYNEFYDTGMAANDPATLHARYVTATAWAHVWNDEYRGKIVPADCRLVIGNSPVGNDIPRQFAELAIATDNVLGYHPYQRASVKLWPVTVRDPGDWQYHSGRWAFHEAAWGLTPRWCFTETAPYMGSAEGWRNPLVLGGDQALLVDIFRRWLLDVQTTPAYREGRIYGPGAWFTLGGGGSWFDYLLEEPQVVALAKLAGELWHPGEYDMDEQTKAKIKQHAQAILDLVDPPAWWLTKTPPYNLPPQNKTLQFYHQDGTPFSPPITRNVTWVMGVVGRSGNMLLVLDREGTEKDWWVRAEDVTP